MSVANALRGNASQVRHGPQMSRGMNRHGNARDGIGLRIATPHLGKVVRRLSGVVDHGGVGAHPLGGEQRGALSLSKIRESSEEYSLV